MATKRAKVQFREEVDYHEFVPDTPEEQSEEEARENSSSDIDSDSIVSDEIQCGSDPEDMESGAFFDYIQKETDRAEDERRYVIHKLKSKTRVGSIFFDKVKRVVAAIQREPGKYDYLIEWEHHAKDKLKPTTSLVKGSHFVFAKPLLYRRYIEQSYLDTRAQEQQQTRVTEPSKNPVITPQSP